MSNNGKKNKAASVRQQAEPRETALLSDILPLPEPRFHGGGPFSGGRIQVRALARHGVYAAEPGVILPFSPGFSAQPSRLIALGGGLERGEEVGDGCHDYFVSLVIDGGETADHSVGRTRRQRSCVLDFGPSANLVAGTDWFGPTHLLNAGPNHRR